MHNREEMFCKWVKLCKEPEEEVDSQLSNRVWKAFCLDLQDKLAVDERDLVENRTANQEELAEDNYQRGRIAAFREVLGLEQDLKSWRGRK